VRLAGYFFSILAVIALSGGHLAVMQTVAWAEMLADYGKQYGFYEGVSKTFDGEHPCKRCLQVKAESAKEQQKSPLAKVEYKSEKFLAIGELSLARPLDFSVCQYSIGDLIPVTRSDSVPSPVPRNA